MRCGAVRCGRRPGADGRVPEATGFGWGLFDDAYFQDRRFCIRPGERVARLGDAPWRFNDKVSSILRTSDHTCAGWPTFY
ncbi:hypothetical protein FHS43_003616 [Streptosporangium becharense]|nr:hypothetical protein [Streptosporangium becharense]